MLKNRIIPCLDVKNGRVVKGINFVDLQDAGDPVEQAKIYSDGGADEICFLDITASNENRDTIYDVVEKTSKKCFVPLTVGGGVRSVEDINKLLNCGADKVSINTAAVQNPEVVVESSKKFDLKIEIGGGIRNFESIQKYTDAGVEKVILGSAAIKDKNFLKVACEKFPNKIALGLDAKDGYLSVSGWKENSNQLILDYLKEVNDYGASRLIYTDINRDGMKQSPNFEETAKVANTSNCPVIISGGVSSIDDIKKAKELNNNKIEGIIVGKAIYDGDIKLDELVKELDA